MSFARRGKQKSTATSARNTSPRITMRSRNGSKASRTASLAFPKPKKENKSTLRKKLDAAFGSFIRSCGYCQMAGKDHVHCGGSLQWCHIVGRSNMRLRWEENNCVCMCAGHHRYYTSRDFAFIEQIKTHFPEKDRYITAHWRELKRWSTDELKAMIAQYQGKSKKEGLE